jgi:hypothetical protein
MNKIGVFVNFCFYFVFPGWKSGNLEIQIKNFNKFEKQEAKKP